MNMFLDFQFDIFQQILRAKLTNVRSVLKSKIIDYYIWVGSTILVMGYLMQSFGLAKDFGVFQFASIFACTGMFELSGNVATLVADFEGDRIIAYYLTLPSSMVTVVSSYICYYLIISMSMSIALLPLGKLMLWKQLDLTGIAWGKLFGFMVVINLLWGFAACILAAYLPSLNRLEMLNNRIIFPMWFFGGFQFSWWATHTVAPLFSYMILLNPVIYATEGIRAVILGQRGYLPFWICFGVVFILCSVGFWWAVKALKRRLDLV